MRRILLTILIFAAVSVRAQDKPAQPTSAAPVVDPTSEVVKLQQSCGLSRLLRVPKIS